LKFEKPSAEDRLTEVFLVVFVQEFHKEVGAYSTINMILEIDMDDTAIDEGLRQVRNMSS
jgi:hypothetical protein